MDGFLEIDPEAAFPLTHIPLTKCNDQNADGSTICKQVKNFGP